MLRHSIPTTIAIHQDINPNSGTILADPTQLHQIVMNICTNSYHAMENTGGEIFISLRSREFQPGDFLEENTPGSGRYVELILRDTDPGIPTSIKDKIFDPYFTTKAIGKGTGMGLSITHGIVKSIGGTITVESQEGEGVKFKVFFPIVEAAPATED